MTARRTTCRTIWASGSGTLCSESLQRNPICESRDSLAPTRAVASAAHHLGRPLFFRLNQQTTAKRTTTTWGGARGWPSTLCPMGPSRPRRRRSGSPLHAPAAPPRPRPRPLDLLLLPRPLPVPVEPSRRARGRRSPWSRARYPSVTASSTTTLDRGCRRATPVLRPLPRSDHPRRRRGKRRSPMTASSAGILDPCRPWPAPSPQPLAGRGPSPLRRRRKAKRSSERSPCRRPTT